MPETDVQGEGTQPVNTDAPSDASGKTEQMCCDGKRTAVEHRGESADGKCCSDS